MRLPMGMLRRSRAPQPPAPVEASSPSQPSAAEAQARRFLPNIVWLIIAQASAGLGHFGLSVMLARHLGAEVFGLWAFSFAFVSLFAVLADFGFSTLAVRDIARDTSIAGKYLGNVLALKAVLAVVVVGTMLAIEPVVRRDATVWLLVALLGGQMILSSATHFLFSVFRAHSRMQFEAAVRAAHAVLLLVLTLALVMAGAAIVAFALGVLATAGASLVLTDWLVLARFTRISLRLDVSFCRGLLREVWPLGLAIACTAVYYYADTIMLGIFASTREVGLYGAAYIPILGLTLFISAIRNAYFPEQSRTLVADRDSNARLLRQYGRLTAGLALPIAIGGALIAEPLLVVLYGHEFAEAATALRLLLLTAGVMLFSSYFGSQLLAGNRQGQYLIGAGLGAAMNLGLNAVLIPTLGMEGAAAATLASESLVCAYMWMRRRQKVPIFDLLGPATLAAAIMAVALIVGDQIAPVYFVVAAGAAIYLGAYYFLAGAPFRRELAAVVRGRLDG